MVQLLLAFETGRGVVEVLLLAQYPGRKGGSLGEGVVGWCYRALFEVFVEMAEILIDISRHIDWLHHLGLYIWLESVVLADELVSKGSLDAVLQLHQPEIRQLVLPLPIAA